MAITTAKANNVGIARNPLTKKAFIATPVPTEVNMVVDFLFFMVGASSLHSYSHDFFFLFFECIRFDEIIKGYYFRLTGFP
jgi:hypothetical protein